MTEYLFIEAKQGADDIWHVQVRYIIYVALYVWHLNGLCSDCSCCLLSDASDKVQNGTN